MKLEGYRRSDGSVGIRNHILVIPTVICASKVAEEIASHVDKAIYLPNQHGCNHLDIDLKHVTNTLIGMGENPNVAAVLFIGLGCETIPTKHVAEEVRKSGKDTECLIIQEEGGTLRTEEKGIRVLEDMTQKVGNIERKEIDISDITIAIECGGSDTTSGIAANPVAGYVADKVISEGGSVIFSETTELIGAENILAERAVTERVKDKLLKSVKDCEKRALLFDRDIRGVNPTPGNIQGGISTIEEKSLGAVYKAGTMPIQGVLDYAEKPSGKGLYFMDTPGHDVESMVGMVAGGAQLVLFTTGRGTPTGSPIAPVIKITGNAATYEHMQDNIDIDVSTVIEGKKTIEEAGERVFNEAIKVINGKYTKSEILGHREFGIYLMSPTL